LQTLTIACDAPSSPRTPGLRVALALTHAGKTEARLLVPGAPLIVGRAPPSGLCIEDRTLSREHARFLLQDDRVRVEDLGSKNGTFLTGRRVERAELTVGDEVVLGSVTLRVQALGPGGELLDVEGEEALERRVEDELARARQFRRPFALLFVRALTQGEALAPEGVESAWLAAVRARVRPVDRVALYGPDAALLLLPETGDEEARRIAKAVGAPIPALGLQPLVGLALYPNAGGSADELIEVARRAAFRAAPDRPVESGPAPASLLARSEGGEGAIIAGRAMQALLETVERVAASRIPVILHGETGTGKEVLARMLHERGPRKDRRLVRVNCGAIPKELVESTLFGHERGAFTGALQQQKGVFEEADKGTVFLDEIGELPPPAQAALLRVLEVGAFNRVGSSREITVDVRVVAATHRDLEAMAEAGAFRADLFYRLSGVLLEIPPLRDRQDEIEPLARQFLRAANEANGRQVGGITPEALALLGAYAWPGNVRELRNVIERAVVITRGALLSPEDLPARLRAEAQRLDGGSAAKGSPPPSPAPDRASAPPEAPREPVLEDRGEEPGERPKVRSKVQHYEAQLLRETLVASGWNRTEAAQKLGIPVRTLSYRMKVLGVKKTESPYS
jgi:DNA-binding NtrC family response regulator